MKRVVDYEAGFVPSIADFDRLDPRFRMSPETWDLLTDYKDWGFAVLKLRHFAEGGRPRHPMAFKFVTRFPETLFFPTLHVHNGKVHEAADFDHLIYFQAMCDRARGDLAFPNGTVKWSDRSGGTPPTEQQVICANPAGTRL